MPNDSVVKLEDLLRARAAGKDMIEDPSAFGGVFVDDETVQLVADLEVVASIGFDDKLNEAVPVLLQVMRNAQREGEDVFAAARDWLDGWLDLAEQAESA